MAKNYAVSLALIILSALFDSYAAFVVKLKFNELGPMDFTSFGNFFTYLLKLASSPLFLSGLVTFILAPGIWFFALNRVDLSVGYPTLVGFHLIFVLIFGVFFLGEAFTLRKGVSVSLILFSLYLLFKTP